MTFTDSLAANQIPASPENEFRIPGVIILQEIGRGASSVVYLAEKATSTGSRLFYAIKVLNDTGGGQNGSKSIHLCREASALARIRHRALVSILEIGETAGRPYFIMEYISGRNLNEALKTTRYSENQIITLAL